MPTIQGHQWPLGLAMAIIHGTDSAIAGARTIQAGVSPTIHGTAGACLTAMGGTIPIIPLTVIHIQDTRSGTAVLAGHLQTPEVLATHAVVAQRADIQEQREVPKIAAAWFCRLRRVVAAMKKLVPPVLRHVRRLSQGHQQEQERPSGVVRGADQEEIGRALEDLRGEHPRVQ